MSVPDGLGVGQVLLRATPAEVERHEALFVPRAMELLGHRTSGALGDVVPVVCTPMLDTPDNLRRLDIQKELLIIQMLRQGYFDKNAVPIDPNERFVAVLNSSAIYFSGGRHDKGPFYSKADLHSLQASRRTLAQAYEVTRNHVLQTVVRLLSDYVPVMAWAIAPSRCSDAERSRVTLSFCSDALRSRSASLPSWRDNSAFETWSSAITAAL
jgi:hypothetical protein